MKKGKTSLDHAFPPAAKDVLMINPLDRDPANHGGAFHFHDGQIAARHPFDEEGILIVNI